MTVADVIAELQKLPPDLLCVVGYDGMYEDARVSMLAEGEPLYVTRSGPGGGWSPWRRVDAPPSAPESFAPEVVPAVCLGDGGGV